MQVRKPQTCSRCHKVKYVGSPGSIDNHKKTHCSDGMKTKDTTDTTPNWPQPAGIFSAGSHFHPLTFLKMIRAVYQNGAQDDDNYLMMEEHFVKMVDTQKLELIDEKTGKQTFLFKLFPFLTASLTVSSLVVTHDGVRYLRVDCLSDTANGQDVLETGAL